MLKMNSVGTERDPLLDEVEDNPVYRLLSRHGNWKKSKFEVYRRNGIDQFISFQDWVWDDLDVCPLTGKDYAQALWAIHAPPMTKSKGGLFFVILSVLYMTFVCGFECYALMDRNNEAAVGGYVIWLALFGFQFVSFSRPSAKMPLLLAQLHSARSPENKFEYLFGFAILAALAMACECMFWIFQVKTAPAVVLKYMAGGIAAFSTGMLAAWVFTSFIRPSREKLLNQMAVSIDLLNQQRRENREREGRKNSE